MDARTRGITPPFFPDITESPPDAQKAVRRRHLAPVRRPVTAFPVKAGGSPLRRLAALSGRRRLFDRSSPRLPPAWAWRWDGCRRGGADGNRPAPLNAPCAAVHARMGWQEPTVPQDRRNAPCAAPARRTRPAGGRQALT